MDVIGRAKAQIAEHEAKIARLREFVAMHRELEKEAAQAAAPAAKLKVVSVGGASAKDIVAAARDIIIKSGQPKTRFELVPMLEKQGVMVGGVDKFKNLGTIMWRSKAFESTGDGYWPRDIER